MKTLVAAVVIVSFAGSAALAHPWAVVPVSPAPVVVQSYYAPAPVAVRTYYAPLYYSPAPVVVARPYMVAAPVVAPVPVAVPAPVYARPVVIHPKVYVWGQPVRNVLRAVTP